METEEWLESLCEQFSDLEESEKDYILGISQALAHSFFTKDNIPFTAESCETNSQHNVYVPHKEYV